MNRLYLNRENLEFEHFLFNPRDSFEESQKSVQLISDDFDLEINVNDIWRCRKLTDSEIMMIKLSYPGYITIIYGLDKDE